MKDFLKTRSYRLIKSFYFALLDLLFPVSCVGCHEFGEWLCEECAKKISPSQAACLVCGKPSLSGLTCFNCETKTPLKGLISVGKYKDPLLRAAVHGLKFSGVKGLSVPLAKLLALRISTSLGNKPESYLLVPLPLHVHRERLRGFNQAELLCDELAKILSMYKKNILIRVRSTQPQASVNSEFKDLREKNIASAFELSSNAPSKILLVDDVATSGATLEEAARVLLAGGAKEVWGAVICRG